MSFPVKVVDIGASSVAERLRAVVIALIAFLTLVDLFAAQAILPVLTKAYGVSPAAMSFAVNASTLGMAAGGLVVALFGARINRRFGIFASLGILAVPTLLLALPPSLPVSTALRIAQGLCMAAAFALTLAYLGERTGDRGSARLCRLGGGSVDAARLGICAVAQGQDDRGQDGGNQHWRSQNAHNRHPKWAFNQ